MWAFQEFRPPFIQETRIVGFPTMIHINFPEFFEKENDEPGYRLPYERCSKEFDAWKQASQECPFVFPVVLEKLHNKASVRMENVQTIPILDWLILLPNSKTSSCILEHLRQSLDALNRVKLPWRFWTFMVKDNLEIIVLPYLRFCEDEAAAQGRQIQTQHLTWFPISTRGCEDRMEIFHQEAYDHVEMCVKNKWSVVALLGIKRRRPPQLARFDKFLIRYVFGYQCDRAMYLDTKKAIGKLPRKCGNLQN